MDGMLVEAMGKHVMKPCFLLCILKLIFRWRVDDVGNQEDNNSSLHHLLAQLKPYTQYAFYVKTYIVATERSGAQSPIYYFRTLPDGKVFFSILLYRQ